MTRAGLAMLAAATALAAVAGSAAAGVYRTAPPPAHTGGFGEPDCGACHFDAIRDDDRGGVAIRAPTTYTPGREYVVAVELRHPELPAGGFQLATRFTDGAVAGTQAGNLEPVGPRTRVQPGDAGVQYASHSEEGVLPKGTDGDGPSVRMRWELRWTAPARGGAVAFDVAAQVASDDHSEFGERLYRARHMARAVAEKEAGQPR